MFANAVVHALVVAAEDHQVFLAGKLVGHLLGERFPVRGREDDLIVGALGLEPLHEPVDRLDHHHHSGIAAEAVVVDLAPAPEATFPDVVYMDFHEPLVLGTFDDGVAQRALQQFGDYSQDVDSHSGGKNSDYLGKKIIFAGYN